VLGDQVDFLADGECVLLRPDHVVAWRGGSATEAAEVRASLLAGVPAAMG
jgi:hypothetical protein